MTALSPRFLVLVSVALILAAGSAMTAHAAIEGGGGGGLPPTATLTASATSVNAGQPVTLTWSSQRATYGCSGTNFNTGGTASGSATVNPSVTTTYQIFCSNDEGDANASRTVTVTAGTPAPVVSLSASPSALTTGQSSTLTWSATNATSCTKNFGSGTAVSGSTSVTPSTTSTYSVTCTGAGGTGSQSATVTVTAPPLPTVSFSISPTSVGVNQPAIATWSSTNATSCTGNFDTNNLTSGSQTISAPGNTTFSVTCTGPGGSRSASQLLYVSGGVYQLLQMTNNEADQSKWTDIGGSECQPVPYECNWTCQASRVGDTCRAYYCPGGWWKYWERFECTDTTEEWVDMGCGAADTYNATCNPTQEEVDIDCDDDEMLQGYNDYFLPACEPPNNPFREQRRCVPHASCVPAIAASCSASPASPTTGQSVAWTASASGGTGTYTYSWSGTDSLSGTAASVSKTYSSVGTKSATVTVTSGGNTKTATCSVPVSAALTASCSVSPTSALMGQSVTWSASASGGTGSYGYSWSGTDGLSGSTQTVSKAYGSIGTKTGSVTVSSGSSSLTVTCGNSVAVAGQPDLTAGSTTFTPVWGMPWPWVGMPHTFNSTASNIGNATATNFPNMFWIENLLLFGANNLSLSPGASGSLSGTHTFTSPGTYNIRSCADFTTGWGTTVSESDENNNCGPWYSVRVAPTPTTGLSASCNAAGTQATLSWTATPGAAGYYVYAHAPTPGVCPSGWQTPGWNQNICITNPYWVTGTSVTYPVTPGVTYGYWGVHSSTADGTWAPATGGPSFACASTPDLTATTPGALSGTVGQALTVSGSVSNNGTGSAAAHSSVIQICGNGSDASCTTVQTNSQRPVGTLAVGASQSISTSWTFPTAGTNGYSYRACADNWSPTVGEIDEGNNCSAWSYISIAAPSPVAALVCTPASCTAPVGSSVQLSYSCTNSTGASLSTFGSLTPVGSGSRTTSTAGGYTLTCTGPGGTDTDIETVSFYQPTVDIVATPDRVNSGGSANVSWDSELCTDVVVTRNGAAFSSGIADQPAPGLPAMNITGQTTFTAVCDGGTATDSVIVNVVPEFEEF